MIIKVEGGTAHSVEAAKRDLEALAQSWGHEIAAEPAHVTGTETATPNDDKAIDPVAITALVLSLPPAALAVIDLADRIQKRRRAKELIDHARQLAAQQVTVRLVSQNQPLELTSMGPDQLIDLLADQHPTSTGR